MEFVSFVGQTLDGKYQIEREIGRGGMGTVYLAMHIGTERPVAVKIIAPKFMSRPEFVERFRREARAAGRLRHPNVVDVTDFGFAETSQGTVAYLVMEYLDGVTLGEVLSEEKQLPLSWSLDILEQVCSAVHEAHSQGIIHRDLKPDNIWLEPNQRGGYTVKVLDFGIAKLEETISENSKDSEARLTPNFSATPTKNFRQTTIGDKERVETINENKSVTVISESETILQPNAIDSEDQTAIFTAEEGKSISIDKNIGTKIMLAQIETHKSLVQTSSAKDLTRVGAVLGTPLYMSPEQCRGERLEKSSDIYSLGVIAYQMLSGETPFTGDFKTVMQAHTAKEPPPLSSRKIPRNVGKVIQSALSKDASHRPPTAEVFASELRANSEGFGRLLQKSLVIYSEHLPKFIGLTFLLFLPIIFFVVLRTFAGILASAEVISVGVYNVIFGLIGIVNFFLQIFSAAMIVGTATWLIAHILAFPLRAVSLKKALTVCWAKKRNLISAVTISTFISFIGFAFCFFPGIYFSTIFMLIAPSIMMENIKGKTAFKRSKQLVNRSFKTALAIAILVFFVPASISALIGGGVSAFSKQLEFYEKVEKGEIRSTIDEDGEENFELTLGPDGLKVNESGKSGDEAEKEQKRLAKIRRDTLSHTLLEIILTPIGMLLSSLSAVITALLYFKTRQAGGESLHELLENFEDSENLPSNWQKRVRKKLVQSGRVTSPSSKSSES